MTAVTALEKLLAACHADAKLLRWSEDAWYSATFHGSRATATLDFLGDAIVFGDALLACIARDEFALDGVDVVEATTVWSNRICSAGQLRLTCQISLLLLYNASKDLAA